eukprot:CAMPEP_0117610484 /NCGR_PEP_ID=MMETSP0784-20121206/81896_1 /TAXON_ID=39447 /ORGANISM="" /LENGTH=587 /DNA_ID=CAMNT_0005413887 /DNA_START=285 /DNA_END=2048 /DNA_ORIENTATION=+
MFYFRATAEASRKSWENVLEENFTLNLPITPYRSFPPAEVIDGQRIVKGIDAVIADSASLYVMLQSIVSPIDDDGKIAIQFTSGLDESIMSDDTFMCKYQMITTNAIDRGCRCEISISGMLKAIFSNNNKLIVMEQTFDVMNFMQQLRRSSGNFDFFVIPNTPLLAEEDVGEARMIVEASSNLKIAYVNQMWRCIFGWNDTSKYIGNYGISLIFGDDSDPNQLSEITAAMSRGLPYSTVITCYAAGNKAFRGWIRVYPLYSVDIVTHFLCVCENLGEMRKGFRITSGNLAANSILIRDAAVAAATAAGQDAGKAAEADSMRNHAPSNHSSSDGGMASTISSKSIMNSHSMDLTNANLSNLARSTGGNTLDNMSGGGSSVAGFSLDSSLPFIRSSFEARSLRNSSSNGSNGSGGERDSDSIPSNPSTSKTNDSSEAQPNTSGPQHVHRNMNADSSSNNKMSASSVDISKDSNSAPVAVGSETNSSEGRTTKAADSSNDGSSGGKNDSNGEPNGSLSGSNSSDNVSEEKQLTANDFNNTTKKHFLNEVESDKMNYEPYGKKRRVQSSRIDKEHTYSDEDDSFDENLLSY